MYSGWRGVPWVMLWLGLSAAVLVPLAPSLDRLPEWLAVVIAVAVILLTFLIPPLVVALIHRRR